MTVPGTQLGTWGTMSGAAYVLVVNIILGVVILGAFASAYFHDRARTHYIFYVGGFASAIVSGFTEMILPVLGGALWARYLIFAAFLVALVLILAGLYHQYRRPLPVRFLVLLTVLSLLVHVPTLFMERGSFARILLYQAPYILLTLIAMREVWLSGRRRVGDWALLGFLALFAVYFLSRPVTAELVGGPGARADEYLGTVYALTSQFGIAVLTTGVAVTLLGMAVAETIQDLRMRMRLDPLTGVLNRYGFEQMAREELAAMAPGQPACLVACDLDRFKLVNDTFGHSAGDAVLKSFAEVLRGGVDDSALCGRFGGEEFLVLLRNCDPTVARMTVEGLRTAFATRGVAGLPEEARFTASFGLTPVFGADDLEAAYARADRMLYAAKAAGRNRLMVDPAGSGDRRRTGTERRAGHLKVV